MLVLRHWLSRSLAEIGQLIDRSALSAGGKAREVLVKKDYFEEVDAQLR